MTRDAPARRLATLACWALCLGLAACAHDPVRPAGASNFSLDVNSGPHRLGLTVRVDGREVGTAVYGLENPAWHVRDYSLRLQPGSHRIEVFVHGGPRATTDVAIAEGEWVALTARYQIRGGPVLTFDEPVRGQER